MTEPTTISLLTQHAEKITAELKKSVGNDIDWREKQAEQWGFIRAHIESQSAFNDNALRWQKDHQDKDDIEFDELNARIELRVGAVSSKVGGLEGDKAIIKGVWLGLTWIAGIGITIGGAIAWAVDHFSKGQP